MDGAPLLEAVERLGLTRAARELGVSDPWARTLWRRERGEDPPATCRLCRTAVAGGKLEHLLSDAHAAVVFWPFVQQSDTHWLWTGWLNRNGYGYLPGRLSGRKVMAHRYAYTLEHGRIEPGLEVDHVCRVRHCVRATRDRFAHPHLEAVTSRVNILRSNGPSAVNYRKVQCPRGHALPPAQEGYWRDCSICKRERNKLWMRGYRERRKIQGPTPVVVQVDA